MIRAPVARGKNTSVATDAREPDAVTHWGGHEKTPQFCLPGVSCDSERPLLAESAPLITMTDFPTRSPTCLDLLGAFILHREPIRIHDIWNYARCKDVRADLFVQWLVLVIRHIIAS